MKPKPLSTRNVRIFPVINPPAGRPHRALDVLSRARNPLRDATRKMARARVARPRPPIFRGRPDNRRTGSASPDRAGNSGESRSRGVLSGTPRCHAPAGRRAPGSVTLGQNQTTGAVTITSAIPPDESGHGPVIAL